MKCNQVCGDSSFEKDDDSNQCCVKAFESDLCQYNKNDCQDIDKDELIVCMVVSIAMILFGCYLEVQTVFRFLKWCKRNKETKDN
jgi:hypothetical protein